MSGFGLNKFIHAIETIEGYVTAISLASSIWRHYPRIAEKAEFNSEGEIQQHLERIVSIYSSGEVCDADANIVDLSGNVVVRSTNASKAHMIGNVHSRTRLPFEDKLRQEIEELDPSQHLLKTVADKSTIRGVHLPAGKTFQECSVAQLRDHIAARGGKISHMNKPELIRTSKTWKFLEEEVKVQHVDRNPNKNGIVHTNIDTSVTRPFGVILSELNQSFLRQGSTNEHANLVADAHRLFVGGFVDDKYDNIARIAPELPEGLIYKEFGNIGQNVKEKNIGDALRRCFYQNETSYHGIAFVPDHNRVITYSKAMASMSRDEKTRNMTKEGEASKKKEYLLLMEMEYKKTNEMHDAHDLGVFVKLRRACCTACVAGQGSCRHRSERLWYQFHHWTEERLGIDRPCTLDACGWAPGGKTLKCDVRLNISDQQTVKHERTLLGMKEKLERGAKRDCTEGRSSEYQLYLCADKQKYTSGRFTKERCKTLFDLLRANKPKS